MYCFRFESSLIVCSVVLFFCFLCLSQLEYCEYKSDQLSAYFDINLYCTNAMGKKNTKASAYQ